MIDKNAAPHDNQPALHSLFLTLLAVWALARVVLLQILRHRLILIGLLVALMLLGLAWAAADVSLNEAARIINDVGLAITSGLGSLVATIATVAWFGGAFNNRSAYVWLARPIGRTTYVWGNFFGLWSALVILVWCMGLSTAGILCMFNVWVDKIFIAALILNCLEIAMVIAITMFFCSFAKPTLAGIYSGTVLFCGHLASALWELSNQHTGTKQTVLRWIFYILPDFSVLSLRSAVVNNLKVAKIAVLTSFIYGIVYTLTTLLLTTMILNRRKDI